jgi:hypothetical protein
VGLVPANWASLVSVDGLVNCGRGKGGWREAPNGWQMARGRSSPWLGAGRQAACTVGCGGGVPTFYSRLELAEAVRARQTTGTSRYGRPARAAWRPSTAATPWGRQRTGSSACQDAHGTWREQDGKEGRRTRRPIALRKPRGARGASCSLRRLQATVALGSRSNGSRSSRPKSASQTPPALSVLRKTPMFSDIHRNTLPP